MEGRRLGWAFELGQDMCRILDVESSCGRRQTMQMAVEAGVDPRRIWPTVRAAALVIEQSAEAEAMQLEAAEVLPHRRCQRFQDRRCTYRRVGEGLGPLDLGAGAPHVAPAPPPPSSTDHAAP